MREVRGLIKKARFVKFVNKIRSCNKPSMINLLNTVMYDCQSTTGSNIRNILLKLRKTPIDEIRLSDIRNLRYFEIPNGSEWKINIVKEKKYETTSASHRYFTSFFFGIKLFIKFE